MFPISHNQSGNLCSMSSAAYGVIRTILRDSSDAFSTAMNNTFLDSDGLVRRCLGTVESACNLLLLDDVV